MSFKLSLIYFLKVSKFLNLLFLYSSFNILYALSESLSKAVLNSLKYLFAIWLSFILLFITLFLVFFSILSVVFFMFISSKLPYLVLSNGIIEKHSFVSSIFTT